MKDDATERLNRLTRVRQAKRAQAERQLVEVAAAAARAVRHADEAAVHSEQVREQGIVAIQDGRTRLLSGPFQISAMSELRGTVEQVNRAIVTAETAAERALEAARRAEAARMAAARDLLRLDARCRRLEDELKVRRNALAAARDTRASEAFADVQQPEPE